MSYHGDIRLGDTIHFKFTTVSTAGAPTTLAGTPSISVYPGSSTTQLGPATVASPANGITPVIDFDGVTGMHHVTIVASSGNGYATATNYEVMISAGTVGGQSVAGYIIGSFSIENRSAVMPTTAARTLAVDASGRALADIDTIKTQSVTATSAVTVLASVGTAATSTAQTGDSYALANGANGFVAIKGDSAAIKLKTDNLPSDPADQSAVEAAILAAWTTALTESYRANGATGTPAQILYEILAHLAEASISGTTKTLKKLDHSTTAATLTLDSATTPTSITRAT